MKKTRCKVKVYDEMHIQGKVSENRIFIVMAVLIVIILALNWVAYHSVEVEIPSQNLVTESQQETHYTEFNPNDI